MTEPVVLGRHAGRKVAWAPQPGPQSAAIACPVEELFYGGARGGGKSDFLIGDFATHAQKFGRAASGLLVRQEGTDMTRLEHRVREVFGAMGATFRGVAPRLEAFFPNGAYFRLGHLKTVADAMGYKGQEYSWLAVDEADEYPDPGPIDLMRGTLRSSAGTPTYLRITGNPGGVCHHWLKARYIDPVRPFEIHRYQPQPEVRPDLWVEAVFIPAKLEDNPLLQQNDPKYEARLAASGTKALYQAWRYGDWNAIVGAVLEEWRTDLHVLPLRPNERFEVPPGWRLAGGLDWGFRAPGCFLLFALGPDEDVIGVDEIYFRGQHATAVGHAIGTLCRQYGPVEYIAADEQMWYNTGQSAPTIAEELQMSVFAVYGEGGRHLAPKLIEASHGRGSRAAKLVVLRRYLAWTANPDGTVSPWGQPRLKFTSRCRAVIRTLPALPYDPRKPEDVDTDAEDHPYDAVTAFLMSRPPLGVRLEQDVPVGQHPGIAVATGRRRPRWLDELERQQSAETAEDDGDVQPNLVRWDGDILRARGPRLLAGGG